MSVLFGTKLCHEPIGLFAQFVQNAGALSQHVRILRVFAAELFCRGVLEKSGAFARVRDDELVADLLIVGHRPKARARGGVQFLQPHNRLDIQ